MRPGGCATRSASQTPSPAQGKRQLGSGPGRPGPGHAARPGSQRREAGAAAQQGAAFTWAGGQAARLRPAIACAAASWRVERGPAARCRSGDAQRRPCARGRRRSPRCWGGGERRPLHAAPFVRVPLTPRAHGSRARIPPTPAPAAAKVPEPTHSAAPPPALLPLPGARGAAGGGDRPRPLSAQLRLPSRGALGPAGGRPACYLQGARAAAASPRRTREVRRLRTPAPGWAGEGRARRAPPPPRSPPRGATPHARPHGPQLPTRASAPHIPPPRPPLLAAIGCLRLSGRPPVPLELIGGRAGDVRPEGASRGAGAARDERRTRREKEEAGSWARIPGQGTGGGRGWRAAQAAGCGGRRGLIGAFLPVPRGAGACSQLVRRSLRCRWCSTEVLPRPFREGLDRSDPDARLPPCLGGLFQCVCLHLRKDSMRLPRSSVKGPAGTRPLFLADCSTALVSHLPLTHEPFPAPVSKSFFVLNFRSPTALHSARFIAPILTRFSASVSRKKRNFLHFHCRPTKC